MGTLEIRNSFGHTTRYQMKILKRQLDSTTLEFGEKSSSSSSPSVSSSHFHVPEDGIMVAL